MIKFFFHAFYDNINNYSILKILVNIEWDLYMICQIYYYYNFFFFIKVHKNDWFMIFFYCYCFHNLNKFLFKKNNSYKKIYFHKKKEIHEYENEFLYPPQVEHKDLPILHWQWWRPWIKSLKLSNLTLNYEEEKDPTLIRKGKRATSSFVYIWVDGRSQICQKKHTHFRTLPNK